MDLRCRQALVVVLASGVLFGVSVPTEASEHAVTVDALQNTVREGNSVQVSLPAGPATLTIQTSGSAQYAPGRFFAVLLAEYKDSGASVEREAPIGGELHIEIGETMSYPLQFVFVDDDPSDNSGSVNIAVSGSLSAALSVSPIQNCLSDRYAASILLPSAPCEVSATGNPWFGWGPWPNVLLMYSGPLGTREFRGVELGAPGASLPYFEGGEVRLFFWDGGGVGDNTGAATVRFVCAGTVSVVPHSWGGLKSTYR